MPNNLIIENCDPKFKELIYDLEKAYKSRMKLGVEINFSGGTDFRYHVKSIENKKFFELLRNNQGTRILK